MFVRTYSRRFFSATKISLIRALSVGVLLGAIKNFVLNSVPTNMNRTFASIFCIVSGCVLAAPNTSAISADDQAARNTALQWVNLIDSGHYGQAFEEQAPRIKAASMGKDFFVKWMNTRRVPLGRARTRSFFKVVRYQTALGWPDGDYQQIAFKTSFERKATAAELIVLTKETGHWQPANYKLY